MKNMIPFVLLVVIGLVSAGGFGELAGPLTFNLTQTDHQTQTWTLINAYNYSININILIPAISNVVITTDTANGTSMPANSTLQVQVTATSSGTSSTVQTGGITAYITAIAGSNSTNTSTSINVGTRKELKIYLPAPAPPTPPATIRPSSANSGGGGSISGYVPKNKTKEQEIKNAEEAVRQTEELLNKTTLTFANQSANIGNFTKEEYTNWTPTPLPSEPKGVDISPELAASLTNTSPGLEVDIPLLAVALVTIAFVCLVGLLVRPDAPPEPIKPCPFCENVKCICNKDAAIEAPVETPKEPEQPAQPDGGVPSG